MIESSQKNGWAWPFQIAPQLPPSLHTQLISDASQKISCWYLDASGSSLRPSSERILTSPEPSITAWKLMDKQGGFLVESMDCTGQPLLRACLALKPSSVYRSCNLTRNQLCRPTELPDDSSCLMVSPYCIQWGRRDHSHKSLGWRLEQCWTHCQVLRFCSISEKKCLFHLLSLNLFYNAEGRM